MTFVLQFAGLALTPVSDASLIVGGFPLVMAIAAAWFQGERLSRLGWSAVLLSTVGVGLVVGSPGGGWLGRCLILVSLVAAVAWVVLTKRLLRDYSPVAATAWVLALGAVMTLPITLLWDGLPTSGLSGTALASLLTLGIACTTVTFTLWNWGLQHVEASRAGVFVNLEPVVGAFLGVTVLGERLTSSGLMGGCLVVACAVLICLPGATGGASRQPHAGRERERRSWSRPLRHVAKPRAL